MTDLPEIPPADDATSGPAAAGVQPPDEPVDRPLDLADVPAVEVVLTVTMHLMTAAALACGLGADEDGRPAPRADLAEARILITALAGLVTASAPMLGSMHAGPLRDGLATLQRAFREASVVPDPPGLGPGEDLTGPVF